jgi:hypothetical protein
VVEYALPMVTAGSELVETESGVTVGAAAAMVMLRVLLAVCGVEDESVTVAVKLEVPAVVGVPLRVPLLARESPLGSPLGTVNLYGAVPPVAARVAEYAVPAVPEGSEAVVNDTGVVVVAAVATAMLNTLLTFCGVAEESVTVMVKLQLQAVVGVPLSAPLLIREVPSGKPVGTVNLYGAVPPVAARVAEYAVPTVPEGREVVVNDTGVVVLATAATAMLNTLLTFCGVAEESVTVMVKLQLQAVVGVPLSAPLLIRAVPSGKPLGTVNLYGAVPPVAAMVAEYAVPTVPEGREVVVNASGLAVVTGATAMLNDLLTLCGL